MTPWPPSADINYPPLAFVRVAGSAHFVHLLLLVMTETPFSYTHARDTTLKSLYCTPIRCVTPGVVAAEWWYPELEPV